MGVILIGQWGAATSALAKMAKASPAAADRAIRDEAMLFLRRVKESFRTQGNGKWKKLSPITRALRAGGGAMGRTSSKGTKALIHTGSLRKSVKLHRAAQGAYFVGVHRTAGRSPGGKATLANVAAIHETGMVVIPITDKMRRYFMWLFWKGVLKFPWPPRNKRYILIPRRSFLRDTFKELAPGHEGRLALRFAQYLNKAGGL
jgi:hypothetical protein